MLTFQCHNIQNQKLSFNHTTNNNHLQPFANNLVFENYSKNVKITWKVLFYANPFSPLTGVVNCELKKIWIMQFLKPGVMSQLMSAVLFIVNSWLKPWASHKDFPPPLQYFDSTSNLFFTSLGTTFDYLTHLPPEPPSRYLIFINAFLSLFYSNLQ